MFAIRLFFSLPAVLLLFAAVSFPAHGGEFHFGDLRGDSTIHVTGFGEAITLNRDERYVEFEIANIYAFKQRVGANITRIRIDTNFVATARAIATELVRRQSDFTLIITEPFGRIKEYEAVHRYTTLLSGDAPVSSAPRHTFVLWPDGSASSFSQLIKYAAWHRIRYQMGIAAAADAALTYVPRDHRYKVTGLPPRPCEPRLAGQ